MAKQKIQIEKELALMTDEQKEKILSVGKTVLTLEYALGIPWITLAIFGTAVMVNPPKGLSQNGFDALYWGLVAWTVLGFVAFLAGYATVKKKYPFYSDEKWRIIHKQRKGK